MLVALALIVFWPGGFASAQDAEKLTMRQAVTLALQNSRDLALARVQYTVALNEAGVDRAAFPAQPLHRLGRCLHLRFPLHRRRPPCCFSDELQPSSFSIRLLKGQQHAAEDRAKNMKLELDRIHDDVIVRAATSYLELAKVRHSLELMRKEQASAEKILGVTRERVAANQELPIEMTRSELAQARVAERIIKLEGREETLEQQIRNLTGIPDSQSIEVDTEEPSFATDLPVSEMTDHGDQERPAAFWKRKTNDSRASIFCEGHI